MKKYLHFLYGSAMMLMAISCTEDFVGQPSTDKVPPSSIQESNVIPMPGGAKISYQLPNETDISYVKGVYNVKGVEYVVRTSVYSDTLRIEGLGSADPLEVTLYVVDHSENVSAPHKVTFTPKTPIIDLIINSLKLQADFGGVNTKWTNELGTEVGITLMATNDKGEMEEGETFYNQMKEGQFSFRGYNDEPRKFSVYVTDKWGNVSKTTEAVELKPLYEKLLDRTKFKRHILPVDNTTNYSGSYTFEKMFDNNTGSFWANAGGATAPFYFTIDLGVEAQLSRFKLYHRPGSFYYKNSNVKNFEVWGTTVDKKDAGLLEDYWKDGWKKDPDWELLGDFTTFKPSGEGTQVTNEDKEYAQNGFEYNIPIEKKSVRYLRFQTKLNWSGAYGTECAELMFWGNDR